MPSDAPRRLADVPGWLEQRFEPDAAKGVAVVYQFELSGAGGGAFHLRVDDGRLCAAAGEVDGPDVLLRLSAEDYWGVLSGSENPDLLHMAGRLAIEGDLRLAGKLRTFFRG